MKKVLSGILTFLLVLIFVSAAGVIDITSVTSPTGDPGTDVSVDVVVDNPSGAGGDTTIDTVTLTSTTLTHTTSGATISDTAPTISPITALAVDTAQTQTFTISLGSLYYGTYSGTITASDSSDASVNDTFDYSVIVNPVASLSIGGLDEGELLLTIPMDKSKSDSFTITNTGSQDLVTSVTLSGDFTDSDDNVISFKLNGNSVSLGTATSVGTLTPGSAASTVTIEATVPDDMELETYEGNVTVTTSQGTTDSFDFDVRVEPAICEEGRMSDGSAVDGPNNGNIRIDINEPDNNDDFKINGELEIDVDVENHGSSDLDIIVEASLWNLNQNEEIENVESDVVDINDDDDHDFTLTLLIPIDEDLLEDESDDYKLYVRAWEDDEEEENCNYDSINLELDRDKHEVIVDSFTVTPSAVSCGSTVSFIAGVTNIGKEDEDDVEIKITAPVDPELELNLVSLPFELDEFGKSGDDASESFTFRVPEGTAEKDYRIIAQAFFNNGRDESDQVGGILTVTNCGEVTAGQVSLTLPQTTFSANIGSAFGVPATLLNSGASAATFTVEVVPVGTWADSVSQDITVGAGQSSTVYGYLTPKEGTADGTYSVTVNVKQNQNLLATNTATVTIGAAAIVDATGGAVYQPSVTPTSIWRDLTSNTPVLIVLIVVVLALIVYLVSVLVKPK